MVSDEALRTTNIYYQFQIKILIRKMITFLFFSKFATILDLSVGLTSEPIRFYNEDIVIE